MNKINFGDMRVWWIPQVGMKNTFHVPVDSVEEAAKILAVLADYDHFQLKNNVKPDYCNVGGLEMYEFDSDGAGNHGWCSWYDEDTGEDDPIKYVLHLEE